ncbi:hypothetical protein HK101_007921 [Irineochytrium annulatum]|nr:hypothetical protein HK101_007921 [Irineochytrium annulatum]
MRGDFLQRTPTSSGFKAFFAALAVISIIGLWFQDAMRRYETVEPVTDASAGRAGFDREVKLPDLLCSPFQQPPPRIAICMAGSARTLKYPLVYKTIRKYVVEAIGGDPVVFAYLKLEDSHDPRWNLWPQPLDNSIADLKPALDYINITGLKTDQGDVTLKTNPNCTFRPDAWLHQDGPLQRFLGQYTSVRECFKLIEDYEKSHAMKFEMVLRIRPDGAWMTPMPPWCAYNRERIYGNHKHPDHVNVMDRKNAPAIFDLISWYYDECNEQRDENDPEAIAVKIAEKRSGYGFQFYDFNVNLVRGAGSNIAYNLCYLLGDRIGNMDACEKMFNSKQDRTS